MSFPHNETMANGVILEEETDWKYKECFELSTIECLDCLVRFIIRDDDNFRLEEDNSHLRSLVVELTGKDPYEGGSVC